MMQMPELRRPHAIACIGCEETKTVQSILIKAVKAAIGRSPGLGGRIADLSAAAAAVVSEWLASVCAAPCKSAFQAAVLAPLSVKVAACRDGVVHCGSVAAWQRGGVARDSHSAAHERWVRRVDASPSNHSDGLERVEGFVSSGSGSNANERKRRTEFSNALFPKRIGIVKPL